MLTLEQWYRESAPLMRRLLRNARRRQRRQERSVERAWAKVPVGTTIRIRLRPYP